MSSRGLVLFGILALPVCAQAQSRTLAVYSDSVPSFDSATSESLIQELQRVLAPAGLDVSMRLKTQRSDDEVHLLVVASFDGNCSVEKLPFFHAITLRTPPLADTSISGIHVLPYFRVDCNRIIEILSPALQSLGLTARHAMLGRALARVMAHEIYHIVGQTTDHQESGIAKAALSVSDMTTPQFNLSLASLRRMQPSNAPAIPKEALAAVTTR
jgi:hypothetical protein